MEVEMQKIVMNVGLLSFFLAVIFFSQKQMPVVDVLLRSFLVFVFLTVMLSIIAITFMKSINKTSYKKNKELAENISRK